MAQALALGSGLPKRGIVRGRQAWPAGKPRRGSPRGDICLSGDVPKGRAGSLPGGLTLRISGLSVCLQKWQGGKRSCLVPFLNSRKGRPARAQAHTVWPQDTLCPSVVPLHTDTGFSSGPPSSESQPGS